MSRSPDAGSETHDPKLAVVIICPECRSHDVELITEGPYAPLYRCLICARMWIDPDRCS